MASSDSLPGLDDCVTVSLTALDPAPDLIAPSRQIVLSKNAPTIRIGRASKQQSKGFVAAQENAWFDSPVMSRYHAELMADFDLKTVLIKDVGSQHGTFRRTEDDDKEDRLPAHERVAIGDGDIFRFGTDIYRGQQTFPPCTVNVNMAWNCGSSGCPANNRATPTNTFSVPDTDDDDVLDEDYNDEDVKDTLIPFHMSHCALDMPNLGLHVIDLTSESEATKQIQAHESPAPSESCYSGIQADGSSPAEFGGYDESFSSEYEAEPGELSDMDLGDEGSVAKTKKIGFTGRCSDENMPDDISSVYSELEQELSASEDDEERDKDEDHVHKVPIWADDSSISSKDYNDETDLSLFEEEHPRVVTLPTTSSPSVPASLRSDAIAQPKWLSPDGQQIDPSESRLLKAKPSHVLPMTHLHPSTPLENHQAKPSDAIAVENSCSGNTTNAPSSTAQVLGTRTGKHDFFAARDFNRASLMGDSTATCSGSQLVTDATARLPTAAITAPKASNLLAKDTVTAAACPPWREPERVKDFFGDMDMDNPSGSLVQSAWTPYGEAFLKQPFEQPLPLSEERTRLQSPELDMTSAAAFEESKNSSNRRRLTVKFLLAQESKEASPVPVRGGNNNSPRSLKRSWDEVFSDVEEPTQLTSPSVGLPIPNLQTPQDVLDDAMTEETVNAPTSEVQNSKAITMGIAANPESSPINHGQVPPPVVFTAASDQIVSRPAKKRRFRKFAKYASVGVVSGVTSAALLFASLAATAPQFA